jgi:hypothetical protein
MLYGQVPLVEPLSGIGALCLFHVCLRAIYATCTVMRCWMVGLSRALVLGDLCACWMVQRWMLSGAKPLSCPGLVSCNTHPCVRQNHGCLKHAQQTLSTLTCTHTGSAGCHFIQTIVNHFIQTIMIAAVSPWSLCHCVATGLLKPRVSARGARQ